MGFGTVGIYFGWVGTVISTIFYVTGPAPPYFKLIQGKVSVNDVPGLLLVFTYFNCILWVCYGMRDNQFVVWLPVFIGGIATLIYISIFLIFYFKKKILHSCVSIILVLNLTFEVFWVFYVMIKRVRLIGMICVVFNILMCAGTLEKFSRVIKSHNYNLIPILSTFIMLINNICWVIYGIGYGDLNLIVPNSLGVCFQVVAICLYTYCRLRYPEAGEIKPNQEEVNNNNINNENDGKFNTSQVSSQNEEKHINNNNDEILNVNNNI